jgi:hypothetical protein
VKSTIEAWHDRWSALSKYLVSLSLTAFGASVAIIGAFGTREALWNYLQRDMVQYSWLAFGLSAGAALLALATSFWVIEMSCSDLSANGPSRERDILMLKGLTHGLTVMSFLSLSLGVIALVTFGNMQVGA